ncbi:hypothetical protein HID58_081790 [Brassica napus]|uniref:Uncharacterized protein n=1 Tax=Brassica napus TaxID=3708 RepID=A0ABQ7Y8S1_BRANA|nr:hypothetical protein HID58_081790 [Brassica napus]
MKLVMFISFLLVLSLCSSGLKEGDEVAENKVEELYGHKMMDYPGPHPDPRDNPHLRLHLRTKKTLWKIL